MTNATDLLSRGSPSPGADAVTEFYSCHPYPPPVANLDRARDQWQDATRQRAEHHLLWPTVAYRSDLDILVAGCGTWQAAKYAVCRPSARVLGIDVSAPSLECTNTLKRKYGLTNLELRQLPIEQAGMQAPYLPQCGAMSMTPHAARLLELAAPDQYAAMELWRGTIAHHSVVLHRDDTTRPSLSHPFDGERWPRYVPLRRPETLSVGERLPPGAAAVLLNRAHLQHDLVMPIDAGEKLMVDAIDGCRSIAEIAEIDGREGSSPRARALFEKLWWYDQIVLDAAVPDL